MRRNTKTISQNSVGTKNYLEINEYKAGMLSTKPQHLVLYFNIEANVSKELQKIIAYPSA
jgi:hypothetical protein